MVLLATTALPPVGGGRLAGLRESGEGEVSVHPIPPSEKICLRMTSSMASALQAAASEGTGRHHE